MKLNLDNKTINLILKFENISFIISLIGIILLYIHLKFYINNYLYDIGIGIFKCGLIAGISSFCMGTFWNGIKQKTNK